MCETKCVCLQVCVCVSECVGDLQGRGKGGLGKGTELCPLCCFVFSCIAQTQTICLPFPPSVSSSTPLVHSLTYRTLLNGQKWPEGWKELHRQTGHSVEMFVQQRKRKRPRKKPGVRTPWVSSSLCLTLSSLSSSLAEGHHSAQTSDKDFQCAFWRKRSVFQ